MSPLFLALALLPGADPLPTPALMAAWAAPSAVTKVTPKVEPTPALITAWAAVKPTAATPAPATTVTTRVKVPARGWHIHKCPSCGHEVSHEDSNKNDKEAHTCPLCDKEYPKPWYPSETGMKFVDSVTSSSSPPVTTSAPVTVTRSPIPSYVSPGLFSGSGDCPGGVCPPAQSYAPRSGVFGGRIFPRLR